MTYNPNNNREHKMLNNRFLSFGNRRGKSDAARLYQEAQAKRQELTKKAYTQQDVHKRAFTQGGQGTAYCVAATGARAFTSSPHLHKVTCKQCLSVASQGR